MSVVVLPSKRLTCLSLIDIVYSTQLGPVQGEAEKPEVSVEVTLRTSFPHGCADMSKIVFLELRKPTLTRRRQYDN